MEEKLNTEEIKQKIFDKLKPSGWDRVFKSFIFSSEFDNILIELWNNAKENKRFTPPLKDLFKAFEECPYDKLQVVMIGQDPYPQLDVADGIAFSCSKTGKEQPSLRFIFDELDRTVYKYKFPPEPTDPNSREDYNPDLKRWSNQGILMLNTALTCEINKIGSHIDLWKPFISYILDCLNSHKSGLVYVYMGKKAEEWCALTNISDNHKFYIKHPASAAYSGSKWDSNDIFNKISEIVERKIVW